MSTIKTGTTLTTAYQVEGDTSGALVIQTGSTPTTALTISSAQVVTFANAPVGAVADGSITTDKLAANAVTSAKLAREGTSGQVLTSNGAGSDPSYQTISTTPTTAQVLTATAGATAGAIGTYTHAYPTSTVSIGGTTAGSNLRGYFSSYSSGYNPSFSGTWRYMGGSEPAGSAAAIAVWLRIS